MVKISFIIPAYNEEKFVGKCLASILAEAKRHPDIESEIIVVNNSSTDGTKNAASFFERVKIIDEPKKGLIFARAAGARAANGELLAHIDADCMLPQGWLSTVLKEFANDEKLVALSGPHFNYDMYDGLPFYKKWLINIFHAIVFWIYLVNRFVLRWGSMLQGGNFVVKKSAWEKIGQTDTSFNFYGEDAELCRRLFKVGSVKFSPHLVINASGRRLKNEGLVKTALTYGLNYYFVLLFKKPATKKYTDVRPV